MIIKSIKITNFRSYYGLNSIDFRTGVDKNITLISGKNGFGKTSFLTALIWGFYGKLMSKVEDKYRLEINSFGGYKNYIKQQFNRFQKKESCVQVEILISELMIPSMPCENITIKRSFNVLNSKEDLEILIDGDSNELTKKIGFETFINDFILPREIAKFFFFDSEKIVSLAEAKTKEELKSLSRAYSEVLGLKKYDDLKVGLKSLCSSIKRRGIKDEQLGRLTKLVEEKSKIEDELEFFEETLRDAESQIEQGRIKSDVIQEKLIREGSTISLAEFKELRSYYNEKLEERRLVRKQINDLLEFVPFMVVDGTFDQLVSQVTKEVDGSFRMTEKTASKIDGVLRRVLGDGAEKKIKSISQEIRALSNKESSAFLLDYSDEGYRKILALNESIKGSTVSRYREIIKEEKNLSFELNKSLKKIRSFENSGSNPLNENYRKEKEAIDQNIEGFLIKKGGLIQSIADLNGRLGVLNKQISELENKQKLIGDDLKKLSLAEKVLIKIENISQKIKKEKKHSLERSILLGMNSLMHKRSFVEKVDVEINEDYLDIHLIDKGGNVIDKESLSKGEQQLYATAILKSLVEESGIAFPVFVDSPLQKFDKDHSKNIIEKFYPFISKQVVLLPLLEKELTFDEFKMMENNVSALYKIINDEGNSKIVQFDNKSFLND